MTVAFQPSEGARIGRGPKASLRDRLSFAARIRFQLLGGALFGVALPAVIGAGFAVPYPSGFNSPETTAVGTAVAVLGGFLVLRRMTAFPGIRALSFVLTSLGFAYALTVLGFFFLRLDYSRLQLGLSFAFSVGWFYLALYIERRVRHPRLYLLPYGDAARLLEIGEADWVVAPVGAQLQLPFEQGETDPRNAEWTNNEPPGGVPEGVTGIVVDLRADLPARVEAFITGCALRGLPVYHSKQIRESLAGRVEIDHLSENTLGSLIPSSVYFPVKRAVDLALAVLFLPTFLVIGAVAAAAIKLDDGGKVFFRQPRVGYRGKVFSIYKFRTMREGSEKGELFTTDGDHRITRVGRFLRHYRIDEVPQILNILRGEMSWIGPRPESEPLSNWYASKIPFYVYRHIVPPGLTGWAAVNQGNVAQLPAATGKLHYDFFYIKNFSPWLDLLIAIRTIGIVLTGFGSR